MFLPFLANVGLECSGNSILLGMKAPAGSGKPASGRPYPTTPGFAADLRHSQGFQ